MQERFKTTNGPDGTTITFIDHPELHLPRRAQKLQEAAVRLVDTPGETTRRDDIAIFKGIHAFGYGMYRANRRRGGRRAQTLRRLYDRRQRLIDYLVNENLGLVHDMQRRSGVNHVDPDDLFSEGLWTLYRAVTRFDPWQGFRFSTYACTSIRRGFLLVAKRQHRQTDLRNRLREQEEGFEPAAIEARDRNLDMQVTMERLRQVVADNDAGLSSMERFVLARRVLHPPGRQPQTLSSLGEMFDLSKEGVRQIQLHAIDKLRKAIGVKPGDDIETVPASAGRTSVLHVAEAVAPEPEEDTAEPRRPVIAA